MKKQSDLSRLFGYAGSFKYLTISSWILSAISALVALLPFVYIWKIIKEVLEAAPNYGGAQNLAHNGWMAVAFAGLSMLVYIGALMSSHIAAFRVASNIRSQAMHHIVTLPLGFMDSFGSGKLRKIVNESSAATETYLAHQLPDRAGAITTPVGMLALLLVFDWRLGLLSLIPIVLAFILMTAMTGAKMRTRMKEYQDALGQMSNEAVEYVRGIPIVKTFGQSVFSFKRFKAAIDNYEKWVISYTKQLRLPMMFYTTAINAVFAVLIAAALVITQNGVSDTFLLNLLFYIIFTPIISVTLTKIMFSSENEMIVADALERIDSVMTLEPMPEPKRYLHPKDNSVVLEDVSFRYRSSKANALDHVSLRINPGEHIAFVGPSGGGKTTLASVIARFWDVDSGKIMLGGVNVKDIPKEALMNTISFVFQDSRLLKTSIFENVRISKPNASREEVLKALEAAQCGDIIEKMPNGIDTVIGTKGVYLSGGEQHRIAIARVMLKNTPIIILDEATAFADPDNEFKVQAAFKALSIGKTVIMIAHRLSTMTGADKIFVLKNGHIEECDGHEELLQKDGLYTHMWREYNRAAKWKVGVKNELA
ncbi:MAG: ABC transporter ATP-binding protein [Firmicutes bacterium HGW-Firmicutes-16]|nr:MAG: ABC transporter ATP-binding protein [Firmicutes bacterium HGW-Firmicutes-16]